MVQRIEAFREGRIGIGATVNDLEALLYELEEAPQEWRDSFIEHWGEMEISYAVALDRQLALPTAEDPAVRVALDALQRLAVERLAPS